MLRTAGKFAGTAAGVAASGSTTQSHCRAQQPRHATHQSKDESVKALPSSALPTSLEEIDGEWLLTDLKRDIDGEQVIFGPDEIDSTLHSVLSFAGGSRHGPGGIVRHRSASRGEVDECASDTSSDAGRSCEANLHIQAAEMQLTAPGAMKEDFTRALSKLLHNAEVQNACVKALKNDPSFAQLLDKSEDAVDIPVHNFSLLPVAAQHAAEAEGRQGSNLAGSVADGLVRLGEEIKQKAMGVRDALGIFLIKLGYKVHALLGRPYGSTPLEDEDPETMNKNAEAVGNALITIACAILALVLVKRIHRVRFV